MIVSIEKPGTPAELVHYGVKGMKWGVRRKREQSQSGKTVQLTKKQERERTAKRIATAKKAAIGAGILIGVAGAGFVAYKLHQNGKTPLLSLPKDNKPKAEKFIHEQTDLIHLSRTKNKGLQFYRKGGTPDYFADWEDVFVKRGGNPDTHDHFEKLSDGRIALAFPDPENRRDRAGRGIGHQVIIPKIMSEGIDTKEKAIGKIWPLLKYDYSVEYNREIRSELRK